MDGSAVSRHHLADYVKPEAGSADGLAALVRLLMERDEYVGKLPRVDVVSDGVLATHKGCLLAVPPPA